MESNDDQFPQRKKKMIFASWKGAVLWYLLSGIIFLVSYYLIGLPLLAFFNPETPHSALIGGWTPEVAVISVLIWPVIFIIKLVTVFIQMFIFPPIPIESSNYVRPWSEILSELTILILFVIAPILSLIITSIAHRVHRRL